MHVWDCNFQDPILFPYHLGLWDLTQVMKFSRKWLYPLSHLPGLWLVSSFTEEAINPQLLHTLCSLLMSTLTPSSWVLDSIFPLLSNPFPSLCQESNSRAEAGGWWVQYSLFHRHWSVLASKSSSHSCPQRMLGPATPTPAVTHSVTIRESALGKGVLVKLLLSPMSGLPLAPLHCRPFDFFFFIITSFLTL